MTEVSISALRAVEQQQKTLAESSQRDNTHSTPPAVNQPARDEVVLSEGAREAQRSEALDAQRVAQIRQAIEDGNYPLDSRRIAESFLALEQMIGG